MLQDSIASFVPQSSCPRALLLISCQLSSVSLNKSKLSIMLSNLFQILTILLVSLGPVWALTTTKSSTRAATKTTATARATATTDFWWSFPPGENYTEDNPYGYDPLFEICGPSCEECRENAKQCRSDQFSNICYEPADGETCCNDVYGSTLH